MSRAKKKVSDHPVNDVLLSAVEAGLKFDRLGWKYSIIGGIAVQRWGEVRQTVDVDAVIWAGFGREPELAAQSLNWFQSRISDAREMAVGARILLLVDQRGIGLDVSLGGLPYEKRLLERGTVWNIRRHGSIQVCSAEDLVVMKAVADRDRDWIDIRGVLVRQGKKLDRKLILEELAPLAELKEEPGIFGRLVQLMERTAP